MVDILRSRGCAVLWIAAFAASLWLRINIPVVVMGSAAIDDGLFVRLAKSLSTGNWLDHYDQYILVKGMFYPLFIAATNFLCIPLKAAEQLVYLLVSALTARFFGRQANSRFLGTVLFLCLAFNPFLWMWPLARVVREGLYISLSLAVVALAGSMLFSAATSQTKFMRAVACGALLGAFWLTREEGVWILPAIAALAAITFGHTLLPVPVTGELRGRLLKLWQPGACLVVMIACAVAANALVAGINHRVYGVYETVELKNPNFVRAYADLAGIKSDDGRPFVVLPAKARQMAYAVSPAVLELKPYLDGPMGESWRVVGCTQSWIPLSQCPDMLAAWFIWAFRDAVAAAGHAGSAIQANAFYAKIADELEAACHERRLPCAHRRPTLAPPFRSRFIGAMLPVVGRLTKLLFALPPALIEPFPAGANTITGLDSFADVTGSSPLPPDSLHRLTGWVAGRKTMPVISVVSPEGTLVMSESMLPAPDVQKVYPDLASTRFNVSFTCPATQCALKAMFSNGPVDFPVGGIAANRMLDTPDAKISFDVVQTQDSLPVTDARRLLATKITHIIIWTYRTFMPLFAAFAVVGYVAAAWRRVMPIGVSSFAAACAAAVATRIALLGYLQVSSIPSVSVLYLSPASPFALLFVGIGLHAGLTAYRDSTW